MLKRILPFIVALLVGIAVASFVLHRANQKEEKIFTGKELRSCSMMTRASFDKPTRKAIVTHRPEPRYSREAMRNDTTGTVTLSLVLNADGSVTNITPVSQLPHGLTEQAIAAAQEIKFEPALKDGQPVSQYMTVKYSFTLY